MTNRRRGADPVELTRGQGRLWEDDSIQFPRLISEIVATCDIDLDAVAESMDLTVGDVDELIERALTAWQLTVDHLNFLHFVVNSIETEPSEGDT